MESVPAKYVQHGKYTAGMVVVFNHESGSTFNRVDVMSGVGVPDGRCVFQGRANKGVCQLLSVLSIDDNVLSEES